MALPWMWGEGAVSIWDPEWRFSPKALHPNVTAAQAAAARSGRVRWRETTAPPGSFEAHLEWWRLLGCRILGGGVLLHVKARSARQVFSLIQDVVLGPPTAEPPHPTVEHIVCEGAREGFDSLTAFMREHPAMRVPPPEFEVLPKNCDGTVPVRVHRVYAQSHLNRVAEALVRLHDRELQADPFYKAIAHPRAKSELVWRLTASLFGRRGQRIKQAMWQFSSEPLPYPCVLTIPGQLEGRQVLTVDIAASEEPFLIYVDNLIRAHGAKSVDTNVNTNVNTTLPNGRARGGGVAHASCGKRWWKVRGDLPRLPIQRDGVCVGAHRGHHDVHRRGRGAPEGPCWGDAARRGAQDYRVGDEGGGQRGARDHDGR